jgi:uncharacterized membrane protein YcgQ (UPF0703/DUF1980 family)
VAACVTSSGGDLAEVVSTIRGAGTSTAGLDTVSGFTMKDAGTDQARVVLVCCAADAQPAAFISRVDQLRRRPVIRADT